MADSSVLASAHTKFWTYRPVGLSASKLFVTSFSSIRFSLSDRSISLVKTTKTLPPFFGIEGLQANRDVYVILECFIDVAWSIGSEEEDPVEVFEFA